MCALLDAVTVPEAAGRYKGMIGDRSGCSGSGAGDGDGEHGDGALLVGGARGGAASWDSGAAGCGRGGTVRGWYSDGGASGWVADHVVDTESGVHRALGGPRGVEAIDITGA